MQRRESSRVRSITISRRAIALGIMLTLMAVSGTLGRRGLGTTEGKKVSDLQASSLTPNNLSSSSPTKEYIYVGGKLVATEECAPTLSPTSKSFPATLPPSGGNQVGNITVTASCNWTASTQASFITITAGSGSGNGTVTYSVTPNIGGGATPRTGTINVQGQIFTVVQGVDFLDVPISHPFYDFIGRLSARGVTTGCGGGNYCPDLPVNRGQMAAFLVRAFNL